MKWVLAWIALALVVARWFHVAVYDDSDIDSPADPESDSQAVEGALLDVFSQDEVRVARAREVATLGDSGRLVGSRGASERSNRSPRVPRR